MSKTLIIDGNYLFASTYSGFNPPYNNKATEEQTIVASAVIKRILTLAQSYDNIAVCFDEKRSEIWRSKIFSDYKGTRSKTPLPGFLKQLSIVKDALKTLNIKTYSAQGYEADDFIGSIVKKTQSPENEYHIFSADADLKQLITDNVKILQKDKVEKEDKLFTITDFKNLYGSTPETNLTPTDLIIIKAIAGDASDNYKGIDKFGNSKIVPLIEKLKTLHPELSPTNFVSILKKHLNELSNVLTEQTQAAKTKTAAQSIRKELQNKYAFPLASDTFLNAFLSRLNNEPVQVPPPSEITKPDFSLTASQKEQLQNSFSLYIALASIYCDIPESVLSLKSLDELKWDYTKIDLSAFNQLCSENRFNQLQQLVNSFQKGSNNLDTTKTELNEKEPELK